MRKMADIKHAKPQQNMDRPNTHTRIKEKGDYRGSTTDFKRPSKPPRVGVVFESGFTARIRSGDTGYTVGIVLGPRLEAHSG